MLDFKVLRCCLFLQGFKVLGAQRRRRRAFNPCPHLRVEVSGLGWSVGVSGLNFGVSACWRFRVEFKGVGFGLQRLRVKVLFWFGEQGLGE